MSQSRGWRTNLEEFLSGTRQAGNSPIHRDNFEMFVDREEVESWDHFQKLLNTRFERETWAFRGQSDSSWRLETSLERTVLRKVIPTPGQPPVEHYVLRPNKFESRLLCDFQSRAHEYIRNLPAEVEVLEWYALMQHYGVPTRLLDWTSSPFVATYFACETRLPAEKTCAVWAIDTDWLNNEAKRQSGLHNAQFPEPIDRRAISQYVNRILRENGPGVVVATRPTRMNERLAAQQGLFLCDLGDGDTFDLTLMSMIDSALSGQSGSDGTDHNSFDGALDRVLTPPIPHAPVCKMIIKADDRLRFLRELHRMNIHTASLFPGVDGFTRSIRLGLQCEIDRTYELLEWTLIRSHSDGS